MGVTRDVGYRVGGFQFRITVIGDALPSVTAEFMLNDWQFGEDLVRTDSGSRCQRQPVLAQSLSGRVPARRRCAELPFRIRWLPSSACRISV